MSFDLLAYWVHTAKVVTNVFLDMDVLHCEFGSVVVDTVAFYTVVYC